jgi:SAM-dependent methyltransferase
VTTGVPPIPWTEAYLARRERALHDATRDPGLLAALANGTGLPDGHGVGLDERLVELPWVLANLPGGSGRVLDAGSSLNSPLMLDCPQLAHRRLHVVTLAPEERFFWRPGVSYLFEDLRALPMADATYDVVISVSTIEHVGCDNTFYVGGAASPEARLDDFRLAVAELSRVLAPGGTLLLTGPYGAYQFHGAFQQFDRARLTQAEAAFGAAARVTESFFRTSADGWQRVADAACGDAVYVEWVAELMRTGRWPAAPVLEPDGAAAARAVACVKLIKP